MVAGARCVLVAWVAARARSAPLSNRFIKIPGAAYVVFLSIVSRRAAAGGGWCGAGRRARRGLYLGGPVRTGVAAPCAA